MQKTLEDLAEYLKRLILPATGEAYPIHPLLRSVGGEEEIREGVSAYRTFLLRLYDALIAGGGPGDKPKKAAHAFENRTTISVYYPFLHHVKNLLMRAGYHGVPGEGVLLCPGEILDPKLSKAKTMECLRFLADCGVGIQGVELGGKGQDLAAVEQIHISYPEHPAMLTGLKAMAIAEAEFGSLTNQDVFLRCDYRALDGEENDVELVLRDTIRTLPAGVQDVVLGLHRRYLEQGLQCTAEIKGFWVYIKYSCKRKVLWGLNASLNNGFEINVKAENPHQYADTLQTFPPFLQEMIARGYGCGKKRGTSGHCDGGCRGLRIPLDDTVPELRGVMETWLDLELACLRGN